MMDSLNELSIFDVREKKPEVGEMSFFDFSHFDLSIPGLIPL